MREWYSISEWSDLLFFIFSNINKISRAENKKVDWFSKYASIAIPNSDKLDERVFVEYLPLKSTEVKVTKVMPVDIDLPEDRPESSSLAET